MSKVLVGLIVKNSDNRFLVTRKIVGDKLDIGLLGGLVSSSNVEQEFKDLLAVQTGVRFGDEAMASILKSGEDKDGKYLIFYIENDFEFKELKNINFPQTEFLWLSYSKIKKLYKEGRINSDQFALLTLGQFRETNGVKVHKNAMKVNHGDRKHQKRMQRDSYGDYVENYGEDRLIMRIIHGRNVKPCGRECREYGFAIAKELNHGSFVNFTELMNDAEFIIEAARITPNPVDCENYLFFHINEYLKQDFNFTLAFLKAVYLNENVYKVEDIKTIVEALGLQQENETLLSDENFMAEFKKRLEELNYQDRIEFHCSGADKEELHDYKVQANNLKVLCDNIKKGLTEILKSFACYVEEKPEQKEGEVDTFWDTYEPREIRHGF